MRETTEEKDGEKRRGRTSPMKIKIKTRRLWSAREESARQWIPKQTQGDVMRFAFGVKDFISLTMEFSKTTCFLASRKWQKHQITSIDLIQVQTGFPARMIILKILNIPLVPVCRWAQKSTPLQKSTYLQGGAPGYFFF